MQIGLEDNIIVLKLNDGEDLFRSLEISLKKLDIRSGVILSGIGMIKEFELGYFDNGEYRLKQFNAPHELVSLMGSVAYAKHDPDQMLLHIHCTAADSDLNVWGGHLYHARVNVINEITILRLNKLELTRIKNDLTGLMELNIEDQR